jgi:hypothetical protein
MTDQTSEIIMQQIIRLLINPDDQQATEQLARLAEKVVEFFGDPASFAIFDSIPDGVDPEQLEKIFTILATLTSEKNEKIEVSQGVDDDRAQSLQYNRRIVLDVQCLLDSLSKKGVNIIRALDGLTQVDDSERDYLLADPILIPVQDMARQMAAFGLTHWNLFGAIRAVELLIDRHLHPLEAEVRYDNVVLLLDGGAEQVGPFEIPRDSAVREICQFADCDNDLAERLIDWMGRAVPYVPHLFENLEAGVLDHRITFTSTSQHGLPRATRWRLRESVQPRLPAIECSELLSKCNLGALRSIFSGNSPPLSLDTDADRHHLVVAPSNRIPYTEIENWRIETDTDQGTRELEIRIRELAAREWETPVRIDPERMPNIGVISQFLNEKAARSARLVSWRVRITTALAG